MANRIKKRTRMSRTRRIMNILLPMSIVLSIGVQAFADDSPTTPTPCPNHLTHTADCGYAEEEVVITPCSVLNPPAETLASEPAVDGGTEGENPEVLEPEVTTPPIQHIQHTPECGYSYEIKVVSECQHSCSTCQPTVTTRELVNLSLVEQAAMGAGKTRIPDTQYGESSSRKARSAFPPVHTTLGQSTSNPFMLSNRDQLIELSELIAADATYKVEEYDAASKSTVTHTYYFAQSCYMMAANIDATGMTVTIGNNNGSTTTPFKGNFEGNGLWVYHGTLTTSDALFKGHQGTVVNLQVGLLPNTPHPDYLTKDYSWYNSSVTDFTISTPGQLLSLSNIVNGADGQSASDFTGKTITLADDIDMRGISNFPPIGITGKIFKGTFNGNHKVIKNLYISVTSSSDPTGLFGTTEGATIKNLGLVDCNIKSGSGLAGAIVGSATDNTTIDNCFSTGTVNSTSNYAGGIAGGFNGTISNCYSTADVTATSGAGAGAGGIVGSSGGTVKNCFASGNIQGNTAGGVAGNSATVTNCVALNRLVISTSTSDSGVARVVQSGTTLSGLKARSDMEVKYDANNSSTIKNPLVEGLDKSDGQSATIQELLKGESWSGFSTDVWNFTPGFVPSLKGFKFGSQPTFSLKDITSQLVPVYVAYTKHKTPFKGLLVRSKDTNVWYSANENGVFHLVPGKYDFVATLGYTEVDNTYKTVQTTVLKDYEITKDTAPTPDKPMQFWTVAFYVGKNASSQTPPALVLDGKTLPKPSQQVTPKSNLEGVAFDYWSESLSSTGFDFQNKAITQDWTIYANYSDKDGKSVSDDDNEKKSQEVAKDKAAANVNIIDNQYKSKAKESLTTAVTNVEMQMSKAGTASFTINAGRVNDSLAGLKKAGKGTVHQNIEYNMQTSNTKNSVQAVKAIFTKDALKILANSSIEALILRSGLVSVTLDKAMLRQMMNTFDGNTAIEAKLVDTKKLSAEAQEIFGDNSVFDFSIYSGSKTLEDFGSGTAILSLPHTDFGNSTPGNLMLARHDPKTNKSQYLLSSSFNNLTKRVQGVTQSFSMYGVTTASGVPSMTDISGHWAKERIDFAVSRGFMDTLTPGSFSPDSPLTQEALSNALTQMSGSDTDYSSLVAGDSEPSADAFITRENLAVIMDSYMSKMGVSPLKIREQINYLDEGKLSNPDSLNSIRKVQTTGIMVGKTGNKFDPQGKVTRAEFASVVYRFMNIAIDPKSADTLDVNDSGKTIGYESGLMIKGTTKKIGEFYYTFDKNGLVTRVSAKKS